MVKVFYSFSISNSMTILLSKVVKRNLEKFPDRYMFKLTEDEQEALRSRFVTLKKRAEHTKYLSTVFTEFGIVMLNQY